MQPNTFTCIRLFDPAIRWRAPESPDGTPAEWATKRDESIVYHAGQSPTRFECAALTRSQYVYVMDGTSDVDRAHRAFACGVRRVLDPSGRESFRPATLDAPNHFAMTARELDGFHLSDLEEIGAQILARSVVPFGSAPRYAVPRTSLLVLDAIESSSRSAAASQASAAETPSEREGA